MSKTDKNTMQKIRVRYDETQALYASQFVLNATEDEIVINFSSGSLPDSQTGENYLPVHSRIALSVNGAKKLAQLLNQAVTATTQSQSSNKAAAQLPSIDKK